MADYDVYVQVAETTVKTYRVRILGAGGRNNAETAATAALRRQPEANSSRFEVTAEQPTTYQILAATALNAPYVADAATG